MKHIDFVFSKFLFLFFFTISINGARASDYYFSTSKGNDSRNRQQAQNPATPWKTISKLNSIFSQLKGGDNIYFSRGEVFEGTISITKSGTSTQPILFGAYGTGDKPIISGFATLQNWSSVGNGVWEAACAGEGSSLNMVTIDGQVYAMGRYPNATDPNKGYLTVSSHSGNNQITSSEPLGSWLGGEVVIRKNRWIIDRNLITAQSGKTLTYTAGSGYWPEDKYGFFIQNHANTLDTFGEWYYDNSRKKLRVFFGSANPSTFVVKASVRESAFVFNGNNYLQVENLSIQGANSRGLSVEGSTGIRVSACDIWYSGADAIYGTATKDFTLQGSTINYTLNNAVSLLPDYATTVKRGGPKNGSLIPNSANATIRQNKISNTGLLAGMGKSGDFTYHVITVNGPNHLIEGNQITNSGYIAIRFGGGNTNIIRNNYIDQHNLVKDDGGGIYDWWSDGTVFTGTQILDNIVLNGVGAPEGTANPELALAEGIYLDDESANIEVARNTVSNAAKGLYVHNAHELNIHDNTFYNNRDYQVYMEHDNIAANSSIRNVSLVNNILAAKDPLQQLLSLRTKDNDIAQFGTFNNNYYTRTLGGSAVAVSTVTNTYSSSQVTSHYSLARWKTIYGFDANSTENQPTPHYTINSLTEGSNRFPKGTFETEADKPANWFWGHPYNGIGIDWDQTNKLGTGNSLKAFVPDYKGEAFVTTNIANLEAGKKYLLKFSAIAALANRTLKVIIENKNSPYQKILTGTYKCTAITGNQEFLIESSENIPEAVIRFWFVDTDGAFWIDNLSLHEADAKVDGKHVQFYHNNTTSAKSVTLDGNYIDALGNTKSGTISLAPYSSVVLMKQTTTVPQSVRVPDSYADINPGMAKVYPVPSKGAVTFEFTLTQKGKVNVSLFASDGTKVDDVIKNNHTFMAGKNSVFYNNAALKPGIYYFIIQTDQGIYRKQLVIN